MLASSLSPRLAVAERLSFHNYSIEDGLAQSQVVSIRQSPDGYLWIGTYGGGVSRFDGRAFRNFTIADGLAGNVVRAIHEQDDELWLGTDRGVSVFDGVTFRTLELGPAQVEAAVRAIADDADAVWIGTDRGLVRYRDGRVDLELAAATLGADLVRSVTIDRNGVVWIGTDGGGVTGYSDGDVVRLTSADGLPSDLVYALAHDAAGVLWIGTQHGLARYADGVVTTVDELGTVPVRTLLARPETLWAGTEQNGLCRLTRTSSRCFDRDNGLSADTVWALAEDRESNLWIGTYRGGVSRLSDMNFRLATVPEIPNEYAARFVLEDRRGTTWVGLYGRGVYRLSDRDEDEGGELVRVNAQQSSYPLAAAEDPDGHVWIGTRNGVAVIDGERSRRLTAEHGLPHPVVRIVHRDSVGTMWVATHDGALAFHDGRRFVTVIEGGASQRQITSIENTDGGLWIATLQGIGRLRDGRLEDLSGFFALDHVPAYAVLEESASRLWLATYGRGVLRCSHPGPNPAPGARATCESFDVSDGLAHPNTVSLTMDPGGGLWVGTERGISHIDIGARAGSDTAIRSYSAIDGFPGGECIHNAIEVAGNGDVWFGTLSGPVRYTPDLDSADRPESLTHITSVTDGGNDENLSELFGLLRPLPDPQDVPRIAHDRNRLTFDFLGISLTTPGRVRYRYRMLGLDERWSRPTDRTSATFANLPPGEYVFEVSASNGLETWNGSPARVGFHIVPPWWQTGWFRGIAIAAAALIAWGAVRLRTRSLRRRQEVLQNRVDEATRDLRTAKARTERLNLELERRVADRTAALQGANESLRAEMTRTLKLEQELGNARKLESLGVLAGGIAHDFNNLLTAISGSVSLARHRVSADPQTSATLRHAESALDRSRLLTRQLLTFSKGGSPIKDTVSLEAIVRETTRFALTGSRVRARVEIAESFRCTDADQGQIGQVVQNLVLNAVQAMPSGGTVRIRCDNFDVESETPLPLEPGPYIRMSIIDDGPGISAEHLPRVFDPYFTTKPSGSGLGLATTYSIVRRHDGHIEVESAAGCGSVFRVYLPASASQLVPRARPSAEPEVMTGSGRILVMDDDAMVRAAVAAILRRLGYDPLLVTDGREAIGAYRLAAESGEPFIAVIVDLTVPGGMGGVAATREILAGDPDACVIVSSGYSDDPAMAEYRSHGFRAVLPKPYTLEELGALLRGVLCSTPNRPAGM